MTRPAVPLEVRHAGHLQGPDIMDTRSLGGMFGGRTTIGSAQVSVTVSCAYVGSDSLIFPALEVGSVGLAVQTGGGIAVNSIVDGISFALARPTGVGVPWNDVVMWTMIRGS